MFVFKAAVVGAGVMGGEIAQVIASADIPVLLKDVKQEFVDKGLEKAREVTQGQTAKLVKKEKLTQEQADAQLEHTLGNITGATEYDGFGDVDFVIEAVPEKMAIKHQVFAELDAVTPGHAVLASNTSEIWRYQDETGLPVEAIDEFIKEKAQMPMGPFRVADMSGLDTVVKVARDMRDAYGDRFYVHKGMEERLERGELGAKTGKGFYEHR